MRVATAGIVLVALAVVATAWFQDPEPVTAAEAVSVAERAFAAAGLPAARVDESPIAGVYTSAERGRRIEVWRTTARVPGGQVELWLAREDGEPVYLDDRTADGSAQLLTGDQFEALAEHDDDDPTVGRHLRRNVAVTAAAVLILALALRLEHTRHGRAAAAGGRLRRALQVRRRSAPGADPSPPADPSRRARPLRADPQSEEDPS